MVPHTKFQNHPDIGWDDVWSRECFPLCSFRSCAAKITVTRLLPRSQDYALTSGSAIQLQNSNCARTWANTKDAEKMFVPRLLAKGHCIPAVGSKRYTVLDVWHVKCGSFFLCSILLQWSLQNLILVLTFPCKVCVCMCLCVCVRWRRYGCLYVCCMLCLCCVCPCTVCVCAVCHG